jgi:hypothetical protein
MRDTLQHLVKATVDRRDSNKFLYILNQIDVTANEDNLEEVFAAWQRALAQYGLTAGSSYAIYNEDAAIPFDNEDVKTRYESKRQADYSAIISRIEQVRVERAYRIVGMLEQTARMLKTDVVSRLECFRENLRRKVLWLEGAILAVLLVAFWGLTIWAGYWQGLSLTLPLGDLIRLNNYTFYGTLAIVLAVAGYVHFRIRRWAVKKITARLLAEVKNPDLHPNFQRAFRKNSRWWRTIFWPNPAGWGKRTAARLEKVLDDSNAYIQKLNDEFTNPSGRDNLAAGIDRPQPEALQQSDFSRADAGNSMPDNTDPLILKS